MIHTGKTATAGIGKDLRFIAKSRNRKMPDLGRPICRGLPIFSSREGFFLLASCCFEALVPSFPPFAFPSSTASLVFFSCR
jgi:hypothetical protein